MTESEIFDKRIIDIITLHDNDSQLNFLKIYPVFKIPMKDKTLIEIWKKIYINIMECILIKTINFTGMQNKHKNTINFMATALLHDLIKYKTSDMYDLLHTMEHMGDSKPNIELIKVNTLKGRYHMFVKSSKSYDNFKYPGNIDLFEPRIKSILDFSAKDIANELTFHVADLIKKISYHELIQHTQNDKLSNSEASKLPINKLIKNFHDLSFIVPTIILLKDQDISQRIKIIKHLLRVCSVLRNLRNYHSLFAIVAGLNNSAVQSIHALWPPKSSHTEKFNAMSELINPINNYKKYRELIKRDETEPIIPYIAITMSDIMHLLEYSLYDFDNDDFDTYMCGKLVEILEKFKNLRSDYKLKNQLQISEWLISINICEDDNYLCTVSSKIINSLQVTNTSNVTNTANNDNNTNFSKAMSLLESKTTKTIRMRNKDVPKLVEFTDIPKILESKVSRKLLDVPILLSDNSKTDKTEKTDKTDNSISNSTNTLDLNMNVNTDIYMDLLTDLNKNVNIHTNMDSNINIDTNIEANTNLNMNLDKLVDLVKSLESQKSLENKTSELQMELQDVNFVLPEINLTSQNDSLCDSSRSHLDSQKSPPDSPKSLESPKSHESLDSSRSMKKSKSRNVLRKITEISTNKKSNVVTKNTNNTNNVSNNVEKDTEITKPDSK